MNLLFRLLDILNRRGEKPPRTDLETYGQTIDIGHQNLNELIHKIAELEQRSPEEVANEIASHTRNEYEHFDKIWILWQTLSRREQEVAALACLGYVNEEIAQKLFISTNTVKVHIRNILLKFSANSKEQLRQLLNGVDFSAFDS